jgi:hypothetical protein
MSNNKYHLDLSAGMIPLFLVFVTLKAAGVIDWDWKWVAAPIWVPILALLCTAALIIFVGLIVAFFEAIIPPLRGKK